MVVPGTISDGPATDLVSIWPLRPHLFTGFFHFYLAYARSCSLLEDSLSVAKTLCPYTGKKNQVPRNLCADPSQQQLINDWWCVFVTTSTVILDGEEV